ncbi:MAG: lysophospholipase [Anaerolineaceae bacterium]|nr:lysophospholipase [Anaerolineaceae bacterium]
MNHSTFTWTSGAKQQIFSQIWETPTPKGAVVLVHGLGEHSSRYQHVAEFFNQNLFSVIAFDLPGHGKSSGKRGHIPSYENAMDIIAHFIKEAHSRFAGLPVFLYGHSMGGGLVLYYGFTRQPDITGIVASAPAIRPAVPLPPLKIIAGKALSRLLPSFPMPNGLELAGLSRDSEVVEAYIQDSLVHPTVSAALGMEIIRRGEWILEQKKCFPPPLLLMQGTADRLVDPKAVHAFFNNIEGDIDYKEWVGFYHELHNEPEKQQVLQYALGWMNHTIKE